jgi:WD40 repeat protein
MTQQKHLKALIRGRQARTGESYSIARKQILDRLRHVEFSLLTEFKAHQKHANQIRFTNDGSELLSGGFSGEAKIWSTKDWAQIGELVGHSQSVNGFAVGATRVVTVSSDRTVRLWDLPGRSEIRTLDRVGKQIVAVDLDSSGSAAWTGGFDGKVQRWTLEGEKTFETKVGDRIAAIAAHPSKDWLAVGMVGPDLLVMDGAGAPVVRLQAPGEASVSVRWANDGGFLVVASPNGSVVLWSTDDWEVARKIEVPGRGMLPIAVDSVSGVIAIGWEHHVGLWGPDAVEALATVDGLPKGVYSLDFSPDGSTLAQCGADGRIRIWTIR